MESQLTWGAPAVSTGCAKQFTNAVDAWGKKRYLPEG